MNVDLAGDPPIGPPVGQQMLDRVDLRNLDLIRHSPRLPREGSRRRRAPLAPSLKWPVLSVR
jgi:hypothetical protein